jgi:hypothetical protein
MLDGVRKWFAVRSYAKGLGAELKKRYGEQKQYTPAQVKRTAEQGGYNVNYLCYALCMYCGPSDFAEYHRSTGEACDYTAMRSEVGERLFGGDSSFDATDVIHAGAGWDSTHVGGDHGGGFDAGDAGGCSGGDSGGGGGD